MVAAFAQFVLAGRGAPAPVAPTEELVVGGLYWWVRNPMYLGVSTAIAGQVVMFASVGVGLWLVAFVLATTAFTLALRGADAPPHVRGVVRRLCRRGPRWRPRLTPWRNG